MNPLATKLPDLATRETRVVILSEPTDRLPGNVLPAGRYAFMEWYCEDPACDCRQVFFQVRAEEQPDEVLATINYGWESLRFYTARFHGDRELAAEIREASLDPLNEQSDLAPMLLDLFREVVLSDRAYVKRLARHYGLFRDAIGSPS